VPCSSIEDVTQLYFNGNWTDQIEFIEFNSMPIHSKHDHSQTGKDGMDPDSDEAKLSGEYYVAGEAAYLLGKIFV
jgi:hypothetical protein